MEFKTPEINLIQCKIPLICNLYLNPTYLQPYSDLFINIIQYYYTRIIKCIIYYHLNMKMKLIKIYYPE